MTPVADARPRSPRRTRLVLISCCASGIAGLALVGSGAATPEASRSVTASAFSAASATALLDAPVLHVPAVPAPASVALRASRSRALVSHKVTRKVVRTAVPVDLWVRPSSAPIISPYGPRWGRMHKGVDFGAPYGAPLHAIGDGVVVGTGYQSGESGYGQITIIRHSNGFYSAYAHQSSMVVHEGDHVTAGQLIGYVGATGEVTGPHLHFEIRTEPHGGQINPVPWLRAHGVDV